MKISSMFLHHKKFNKNLISVWYKIAIFQPLLKFIQPLFANSHIRRGCKFHGASQPDSIIMSRHISVFFSRQ